MKIVIFQTSGDHCSQAPSLKSHFVFFFSCAGKVSGYSFSYSWFRLWGYCWRTDFWWK